MNMKLLISSAIAAGTLAVAAGPVFASTHANVSRPISPRMASTSTHAGMVVAQASAKHRKNEQNENENDAPGDAGDQGEK